MSGAPKAFVEDALVYHSRDHRFNDNLGAKAKGECHGAGKYAGTRVTTDDYSLRLRPPLARARKNPPRRSLAGSEAEDLEVC